VAHYRTEIQRPAHAVCGPVEEEAYRKAGRALRQRIWDPVARELGDPDRIFVVPDGPLHLVSVSSLPKDDDRYWIDESSPITYLSAERDLEPVTTDGVRGEGLLAMGNVDFDAPLSALSSEPVRPPSADRQSDGSSVRRGSRPECSEFASVRFEHLPASAGEIATIEGIWRSGTTDDASGPITLTGAMASETSFKERAPGHRVVHLATHGFFLGGDCVSVVAGSRGVGAVVSERDKPGPVVGENPLLLTGLAMAGANRRSSAGEAVADGILTAEEIAVLDLSGVEWAVLSACDTGLGEIRAGEGVLGLRRAFEVSGVGTLIMSLWSVEDRSAQEWMTSLYEARYLRNASTATAVHDASRHVLDVRRASGESDHPFYWAGFVAAGDWR
jgi:CHAT domain-containing protein